MIEAAPFRIDQEQLQLTFDRETSIDFLSIAAIDFTETHGTVRRKDQTVFAHFELANGDYAGYLPAFCYYFGDRIVLAAEPYPA